MNKWKDKWFYYKLIAAILILGGLLAIYLYHMIAQVWIRNVKYPFSFVLFQGQYISYFTYQSNIIIGMWFLLATIYHGKKNRLIESQNIRLAITAYISVTCLTYVMVLFPAVFVAKKPFSIRGTITGIFFHIITPSLMIFYSLYHLDGHKWSKHVSFKKGLLNYLFYPWIYVAFILMRITLFLFDSSLKDVPFKIVYPYAPLLGDINTEMAFNSKVAFFLLIIAFFVFVQLLFILFYFLYFYLLKKISLNRLKKQKKEKKLIIKL